MDLELEEEWLYDVWAREAREEDGPADGERDEKRWRVLVEADGVESEDEAEMERAL